MKFLVIQQKMIGDVLTSSVICKNLKLLYPDCEVHYVVNPNTLPVLKNNPSIDKVILFKQEYRDNKLTFFSFLRSLRKDKYHAVIDAYGKLESNLMCLFARANMKISHPKWYTSWVYTDTVSPISPTDGKIAAAIVNRLRLLNPIIKKENTRVLYPELYISEEESKTAKMQLINAGVKSSQKPIMVSVLGSGADKTYPPKFMASFLDIICTQTNATLLFNYIPNQKQQVTEIYNLCKPATKKQINIDFFASSLREFIALLPHCSAVIGNEGGAGNMAKALQLPTFSIFSPYITKEAWQSSGLKDHIGVHLSEYYPELFTDKDKRMLRKESEILYKSFTPDLFKNELQSFLLKYTPEIPSTLNSES